VFWLGTQSRDRFLAGGSRTGLVCDKDAPCRIGLIFLRVVKTDCMGLVDRVIVGIGEDIIEGL
jgi:hypothetical protein